MRMRLMLLGGGNALGQALIRLGAEEDIGFLAPRPPAQGWDAASLTQLLDDNRPDVVINLAYYYDWFQSGQPNEPALAAQERAVERLAELCQHHDFVLLQPSSYRVFDGARTTAYSERMRSRRWMPGAGALAHRAERAGAVPASCAVAFRLAARRQS